MPPIISERQPTKKNPFTFALSLFVRKFLSKAEHEIDICCFHCFLLSAFLAGQNAQESLLIFCFPFSFSKCFCLFILAFQFFLFLFLLIVFLFVLFFFCFCLFFVCRFFFCIFVLF